MEGRTELHAIANATLTAVRYPDEILRMIVRPDAVVPGFLLVQDSVSLMWPTACRQFLDHEGIDAIAWHSSSPDLNPWLCISASDAATDCQGAH